MAGTITAQKATSVGSNVRLSDGEVRQIMNDLDARCLLRPLHEICRGLHVKIEQVIRKEGTRQVTRARDACYDHCMQQGLSFKEIGDIFRAHHTSVIYGVERHAERGTA